MKLVDRYVHDVARRLPEKQRADVAKELKVEIEEMIEGRSGGKVSRKQAAYDVLVELGSPSRLADSYRERPRFLIGPDYYEPYIFLLKTIFAVVLPLLTFIVWMTEAMSVTHTPLSLIIKILGVLFDASIHIFFWTTLSFVFVQKMAAGQPHDYNWKPEDLPELPPEQEITRGESFFAIAWSVFAILATLYQVPVVYQLIGPDDVPQFFAPDMWPGWTLGLLAISVLGLVTEWVKLFIGGWTKLTVGLVTIANLVTVIFFLAVLQFVQPIANPAMMALLNDGIAESVAFGIRIFVGIVIVLSVWEVGEALYKYRKGVTK